VKNDGTLWGWGGNWSGQLGLGKVKAITNAVQIGTSTQWARVWAGSIQTMGLQTDGSLWFWGSLTGDPKDGKSFNVPTRVSPDTDWVDACFGYFTMFALKSDGTLWTWGLKAAIYNGGPDNGLDGSLAQLTPTQIGTENDWQSCASAPNGFYTLLQKKDGSLWALDASEHRIIKPASEYKPVKVKEINLHKDVVAYTAGGDNLGVVLTRDGEVWTWGSVLGEHTEEDYYDPKTGKQLFPKLAVRDKPWQLSISDPAN
jgi:alpha-tubulin suppressor-like RCC1 family protein